MIYKIKIMTLIGVLALAGCNKNLSSDNAANNRGNSSLKNSLLTLDGTDTGGGGSTKDIQKLLIEKNRPHLYKEIVRITTGKDSPIPMLPAAALSISENYLYYQALPSRSANILQDMKNRGLWDDVRKTKIVIQSRCVDQYGKVRSATSPMNVMAGAICLNPDSVIDDLGYAIPDSALIALIMHEYAHHFGYEDKDYSFAKDIALAIEEENKNSVSRGENPNTLIQPEHNF